MFDPQQHPRDSRGRFVARSVVENLTRILAVEDKRDEISVPIPDDSSRVWMDVDGLTAGQIDVLNSIADRLAVEFGILSLASAKLVSDWITGTDNVSPVLADPDAIDGARAYVSDALTDRAEFISAPHPPTWPGYIG